MPSDIIHDPAEIRRQCRAGTFNGYTAGQAPGRVQANLMIVPTAQAYDFAVFCQRNPKPCPVLDITDPGDPEPRAIAPGADIRYDLPRYRVFRHGELVDEPTDITDLWRDDLVGFLIGCSYTFEDAMVAAGAMVTPGKRVPSCAPVITQAPSSRIAAKIPPNRVSLPA